MSETKHPKRGELYAHRSGVVYRVLSVANTQITRTDWSLPPCVAYEDVETGVEYARPLSEWDFDKYIHKPDINSD